MSRTRSFFPLRHGFRSSICNRRQAIRKKISEVMQRSSKKQLHHSLNFWHKKIHLVKIQLKNLLPSQLYSYNEQFHLKIKKTISCMIRKQSISPNHLSFWNDTSLFIKWWISVTIFPLPFPPSSCICPKSMHLILHINQTRRSKDNS